MQNEIIVKIKVLDKDAVIPQYATDGSSCADIIAIDDGKVNFASQGVTVTYRTGLSFEIPKGYALEIFARSSIANNTSLILANGTGQIDSDYRGEVLVQFRDISNGVFRKRYKKGDRICQMRVVPIPQMVFQVVDELSPTSRGSGGFGSTGT